MSIAFVQSKTVQSSGATSLTTASFVSTAGNFLVAGLGQIGTNLSGSPVSDSASGTWTNALLANGGTTKNGIYYQENIAGSGTQTVTYTRLGGSGVCALIVMEFSSVALGSSLDKTASTNSASRVKDSGNTAAITQADELLIGIGGVNTNTSLPASVPSLFTDVIQLTDSGPEGLLSSYAIVSAIAAYTFKSDYGSAASSERIGIAAFKGSGIAFVQSVSATSSGATSLTTAGITTTSGNFISAFGTSFTRTFSTTVGAQVADNKSNTFLGAWAGANAGQFYGENITGGASHTFTLTPPGGSSACSFAVMEFSGLNASSSLDVTASTSSSTAPRSSGATAATAQANELLLGGSSQSHLSNTVAYSSTPGGPWSDVALGDSSPEGLILSWRVVSAIAAYNFQFTEGTTLVNAGVGIATFRAGSSNVTLTPDAAISTWVAPTASVVVGAANIAAPVAVDTWIAPAATVVPGAITVAAPVAVRTWVAPAANIERHEPVRITAHRVTALRVGAPPTFITQHRVTVLRIAEPTPPDPPTPSDDPCDITEPIYWAVIKPSGELGDVYQGAIASLCDPVGYYGDYKQPSILSINSITRASSDFLTGSLPAQSVSVTWADANHFVRDVFATTRSDWNNSEIWIYLIDNATRLALGTPRLLFYGIIKGDTPGADLTYITPAYDLIGATYSITGDDVQIPKRVMTRADFPGCPNASVDLGVPIIFGSHSKSGGALKIIDAGDFTCQDAVVRRCLLVAGHACKVVNPFHNGTAIPDPDYGVKVWAYGHAGWTDIVPGGEAYVEINDQWFSLVFVMGAIAAAYDVDSDAVFRGTIASAASKTVFTLGAGEGANFATTDKIAVMRAKNSNQPEIKIIDTVVGDVVTLIEGVGDVPVAGDTVRSAFVVSANQTAFVYVDVDGQDVDGDATGSLIDDLLPQDLHALENWYYGNYKKGDWFSGTYTFKFYPGGDDVQLFDRQSWFDTHAVSETYLSGGFKGAFILGAQGRRRSMRSNMSDTAVSGNFMRSMRGNNQLFVYMLDRDRTRFINGRTTITDRRNILDNPKFVPQAMRDWLCNDLGYRYDANYRDDGRGSHDKNGQQGNAPSVVLNGTVTRREAYNMVRDQATADAVGGQRLAFMAYTPQMWTWSESLCGLNRQVSDGVAIDHYNGTGQYGFLGQGLWILKQICEQKDCKVTFSAIDVEHLLSDSYELIVIGGTGSGHYPAGTTVTITAGAPDSGFVFDQWTGDPVASSTSSSTTVTMPTGNMTVIATYEEVVGPALYTLTVVNGSGGGNYAAGTIVYVSANAPSTGYEFDEWTGDTVDDDTDTNTFITMPAGPASVTATYILIPEEMLLDVEEGTGDGSYPIGDVVAITAGAAPMGMSFAEWIGEPSTVAEVADVFDPTTTINIIDQDGQIRLEWTASVDVAIVAGYRVLYGTSSGVYPNSVDIGNVISYLLSGLTAGVTYYIVVASRSTLGIYSDYSDEISAVAYNMKVTATYA